ncbi:MAG: LytTR family DNA-binding domain-containing protein [Sphingomonas sp.]
MTPVRVLICDDEPLAITRLQGLLATIPDVEIVGTALTGRDAITAIKREAPDLALLDIEMPDMDGFDVVEALCGGGHARPEAPLIAFVTAFRRFAPQAFDSGAIDFLSKPVRLPRLKTMIDRARLAVAARDARQRLHELQNMLDALREHRDPYRDAHVWVQRRGEMARVDLHQVDRVSAEGAYVRLFVDSNSFLHREPIGSIATRLDPARFIRVHRSHIVRVDHVASIHRTLHGASELNMRDGERLPLGRKFAKLARARLFERGDR